MNRYMPLFGRTFVFFHPTILAKNKTLHPEPYLACLLVLLPAVSVLDGVAFCCLPHPTSFPGAAPLIERNKIEIVARVARNNLNVWLGHEIACKWICLKFSRMVNYLLVVQDLWERKEARSSVKVTKASYG